MTTDETNATSTDATNTMPTGAANATPTDGMPTDAPPADAAPTAGVSSVEAPQGAGPPQQRLGRMVFLSTPTKVSTHGGILAA
jgi:hypothetical protein